MIDHVPNHGGQLRNISARFNIPVPQLLDFSANINPDGPPPSVLLALRTSLDDVSALTAYPDIEEVELKQAIAGYAGVSPRNISVANGFIPLLQAALRALKIKHCLLPVPAFVEYRHALEQAGVEVEPHVLTPDSNFCYDMDALVHGDHDAVLLANPQNPSGALTNKDDLLQFVSECAERNITVLLDEAFCDYTPFASLTQCTHQYPNLIVFRSVTKFHGIPGLRVAYAVANEIVTRSLSYNLSPWPITILASHGVAAALADQPFADRTRLHNDGRRSHLKAALEALGIHTYPAAANFLLLRLPCAVNANHFWQRMIVEHHLVLRNCSDYEALPPGHLRIAVCSERDNEALVRAVNQEFQKC